MGIDLHAKPARAPDLSDACHPIAAAEAEAIAARLYNVRGSATRFETEKDDTFLLDAAACVEQCSFENCAEPGE